MLSWLSHFYVEEPLLALCGAAFLALLSGYLVQAIGLRILKRIVQHFAVTSSLVRSTSGPMRAVMPLIFLQLTMTAAPDDLQWISRIRHSVGLLLIGALTWLVVRSIAGVSDTIVALRPISIADNLRARGIQTQTRVIARTLMGLVLLIGVALMLMTFPEIRALGASLLASAGLAGIVAGLAAKPVLGNLVAGLQIAVSQPIRIDDVLIVEGEWGRVEEITGAYVILCLWDQRRLVVPLQWFIEHPFQNWTRSTSEIIGSVFLWVDYRMPLAPLRAELQRLCDEASDWDKRVSLLQVTDANTQALQLRILVSSADSGKNWDLRCKVREGLVSFMQSNYQTFLPLNRVSWSGVDAVADGLADNAAGVVSRAAGPAADLVGKAVSNGNGVAPDGMKTA